jgi:hypothetical protein
MWPSLHQYRLPPVPVPITVAVDGSDPEALGVVCAPRTAVGEGDTPGGDGEAEVLGVLEETGAADGDADALDGTAVVATGGVADVVATGDGLCVTVAGELGEGLARA